MWLQPCAHVRTLSLAPAGGERGLPRKHSLAAAAAALRPLQPQWKGVWLTGAHLRCTTVLYYGWQTDALSGMARLLEEIMNMVVEDSMSTVRA